MNNPPIVAPEQWEARVSSRWCKRRRTRGLVAPLAAERRRMPWSAVEKDYRFEGSNGPASLLQLFDGRRQLIIYRAFAEPGAVAESRNETMEAI